MSEDQQVIDKEVDGAADKSADDQKADPGGKGEAAGASDKSGDKSSADDKKAAGDDGKAKDDAAAGKDDKAAESVIPDNWRELAADGDEDTLKLLKRYGGMKGVAKALKEKEALIRSGKVIKSEAPDPKDEAAVKEWRKQQGIPEDATGYVLPEDVTKRMTDDDKPLISNFTEYAFGKNAPQQFVDLATGWYFDQVEALEAAGIAADKEAGAATEEALRAEWGAEYKGNRQLAERFLESIPGLGVNFASARVDGRRLADIPEFVEWAREQGFDKYGDPVFATSDSETRHSNRKVELEKIMKTDFQRYEAEGLDKEYATLLEREAKRKR